MSQTDRTLHQAPMTKVGRTLGKGVFAALGWLPALLPAEVWVEGMGSVASMKLAATVKAG